MIRITNIFYLIFILTINSAFGQVETDTTPNLVCKQLTGDVTYLDSIKFQIKRNFDKMICFQISLEKNINNSWTIYTSAVLNKPFSKAPEICAISNEEQVYSFKINSPELFEKASNGSIVPAKGNSYKTGLFRLKIIYGFTSDSLSKLIYLPEFKISKPNNKTKNAT